MNRPEERVSCPKACGWESGNPDFDEDGQPYTCYCCYNEGTITVAEYEAYKADEDCTLGVAG